MTKKQVPFFRPCLNDQAIEEVVNTLRSGWLTSGPKVQRFEKEFAAAVGGKFAVAVNSCTAALHLAVEALGLKAGQAVLVPAMTFAATAEIVRYLGAIPILVDCDPITTNMDLGDAARKLKQLRDGTLPTTLPEDISVVGIIPVHVGGLMMNIEMVKSFAVDHNLWVVEDAAHSFPAAWRSAGDQPWQRCGEATSTVCCFSFYANKTITTGEGGMAITDDGALADRMRLMSLHGLSHDAWGRYAGGGSWDYKIVAPGYKYNLTDIAASIGIHQLAAAEDMRIERAVVARHYLQAFADVAEIELPVDDANCIHSWHLFPIKLHLERLKIDRNTFKEELRRSGVATSVHWRPLHLHPYYQETFAWQPELLPVASAVWPRLLSLPIFSQMRDDEIKHVIDMVKEVCARHAC